MDRKRCHFTFDEKRALLYAPTGSFCCWLVDDDMYLRTSISGEIIVLCVFVEFVSVHVGQLSRITLLHKYTH